MIRKLALFLELIKFEHTIFALPFAYIGMILACRGFPGWKTFVWISVAMAAARTVAMGVNRLADKALDARNPRTQNRPLVTGRVTTRTAWAGTAMAAALFVLAAWRLGRLPLLLMPVALFFLVGYAFSKRFTWTSHYILGFTDGLAPVGAWLAVRQSVFTAEDLPAWILLGVVTTWIGGFDILYACQDLEFDRKAGLQAIPARFGARSALIVSAVSHLVTVGFLVLLGFSSDIMHWTYVLGVSIVSILLVVEHALVSPRDLSRMNIAFFHVNSIISVVLLLSVTLPMLLMN